MIPAPVVHVSIETPLEDVLARASLGHVEDVVQGASLGHVAGGVTAAVNQVSKNHFVGQK